MNKILFNYLKELKKIEPDPEYSRRSRFAVLAAKPAPEKIGLFEGWKIFHWQTALELSGALAIALVLIFYYAHQTQKANLVVQANEINNSIQIQLNEIKYILQTRPPLNNTAPEGDIGELLLKATGNLKDAEERLAKNDIGGSLIKIKETQAIFAEIETAVKK